MLKGGITVTVTAVPLSTRLQLLLQVGVDYAGRPVLRTRAFANLKSDANHADLYQTGQELASLQNHLLHSVRRVDEIELGE